MLGKEYSLGWVLQGEAYQEGREQKLKVGSPLDAVQNHFKEVYGKRNAVYLDGRINRINFFNIALGDIEDAVRKDAQKPHLETVFARAVSRVFSIAQGINDVDLATAMSEKYPESACGYCGQNPCGCRENRPLHTQGLHPSAKQLDWSLSHWQEHLDKLYGKRNRDHGISYVLLRLFKESSELSSIEDRIKEENMPRDTVEHEYSLELADALAWIIAAANMLEVNLEKSVIERYGNGCSTCNHMECGCGNRSYRQLRLKEAN